MVVEWWEWTQFEESKYCILNFWEGHIHFFGGFLSKQPLNQSKSKPHHLIFFPSCSVLCPSCEFAAPRCPQVVPAGAARAADDVRALQRLDPGLQVSISSQSHPWFAVFNLQVCKRSSSQHLKCLLCPSAAFRIKTRGCRRCSTPARNCLRPTTTTSSE